MKSIRELIPNDVLEESLPESLLKWFKNFMHWAPSKLVCSCTDTKNNSNETEFMQMTVEAGNSWRVGKIEVHTCKRCGSVELFPRYNDVLKIAEARTGRCGEWSILFGVILNSVSLEARIVHDYLDHCWNEVLLDGKWLHVDSTLDYPASLNQPYYYEQNWKKQYMYVLAFAADKMEDVTPRYTQQWNNVLQRRQELQQTQSINQPTSIAEWQNSYSSI